MEYAHADSKNKTGTPQNLHIAVSLQDNQHIAIFPIHSSLQKMIQDLKEPDMFISFPIEVVSGSGARGGGALTLRKEISGNRDEAVTRNRHNATHADAPGEIFTAGMGFTGHLQANTSEVT